MNNWTAVSTNIRNRITIGEAKKRGYIVDTCCYPYFGYKGPRFQPTESVDVFTELEEKLLSQVDPAKFSELGILK